MREVTIGKFLEQRRCRRSDGRVPLEGSLAPTHRCNLSCNFCYCNLPANDKEAKERELSLSEIERVLDETVDAGCIRITLTGGEPTLRPDFRDIYRAIGRRGLIPILFTNALLLSERHVEMFREFPPERIEVSVYGASDETYRKVTGRSECLGKLNRVLDVFDRCGVAYTLKATLSRENVDDLPGIKRMAKSRGSSFYFAADLIPRIDGRPSPVKELRLSYAELMELYWEDEDKGPALRAASAEGGADQFEVVTKKLFECAAGTTGFFIDPYGRLSPCNILPVYEDLRRTSFSGGWNGLVASTTGQVVEQGMRRYYSACPAKNYLETGSLDKASSGRVDFARMMSEACLALRGVGNGCQKG